MRDRKPNLMSQCDKCKSFLSLFSILGGKL